MPDFAETPNGICVMNPIMGEFTLCGDAFDLFTDEPEYEQRATNRRTVTCPQCSTIILSLRGVRASAKLDAEQGGHHDD